MRRPAFVTLLPLILCLSCVGCRKDDEQSAVAPTSPAVARCVHGVGQAIQATTYQETSKVYYEECADVFSETVCRDAWHAAARAEPSAQLGMVSTACRKSYCPGLASFGFAICKDDWAATPQSLERDWPPLFAAMIAREAGMSADELQTGLLAVYAHAAGLKAMSAAASASAAPPAASGSAAVPAPPPSSGAPAASGGAPPAPSSSGAKPTPATPSGKPAAPAAAASARQQ